MVVLVVSSCRSNRLYNKDVIGNGTCTVDAWDDTNFPATFVACMHGDQTTSIESIIHFIVNEWMNRSQSKHIGTEITGSINTEIHLQRRDCCIQIRSAEGLSHRCQRTCYYHASLVRCNKMVVVVAVTVVPPDW